MKSIFAILFLVVGFQAGADTSVEVTTPFGNEFESQVLAKTFVSYAAVHSSDSYFQCNYSDENRAMRLAADVAVSNCYEAGLNSCQVMSSIIVQTGYLGYRAEFGKTLGYGCLAKAIVRGN